MNKLKIYTVKYNETKLNWNNEKTFGRVAYNIKMKYPVNL